MLKRIFSKITPNTDDLFTRDEMSAIDDGDTDPYELPVPLYGASEGDRIGLKVYNNNIGVQIGGNVIDAVEVQTGMGERKRFIVNGDASYIGFSIFWIQQHDHPGHGSRVAHSETLAPFQIPSGEIAYYGLGDHPGEFTANSAEGVSGAGVE